MRHYVGQKNCFTLKAIERQKKGWGEISLYWRTIFPFFTIVFPSAVTSVPVRVPT
jgi:hypothetical protein